jgi:predicted RNA-binding protein
MSYWIFTVTGRKADGKFYPATEIFNQRMQDKFWGIGEKTPNKAHLREGDKIVFYIGIPTKAFGGTATLASAVFELDEKKKTELAHGREMYTTDLGVFLEDIDMWRTPKPVEELLDNLNFIENKPYWGSYFQGGVREIVEDDYLAIIGEREISLIEKLSSTKDIESQTEFALETHLEEFIYSNWSQIDWGSNLELYRVEDLDGRQYPAGTWSIDFLTIDKDRGDLVVIELKRGKTSDATVGQLLRYIHWVEQNVAEGGVKVRGIIIAREVDEALRYSVMGMEKIEVNTYQVDFKLRPMA